MNPLKTGGYCTYHQAEHSEMFCAAHRVNLRILCGPKNSDYFLVEHCQTGFYNRNEVCLPRGANWIFTCNFTLVLVLKGYSVIVCGTNIWRNITIGNFWLQYNACSAITVAEYHVQWGAVRSSCLPRHFQNMYAAVYPPLLVVTEYVDVEIFVNVSGPTWEALQFIFTS